MEILLLRVAKNGVLVLCNGKCYFTLNPAQEVTFIVSLLQKANCKLHHGKMEENTDRARENEYRTKHSS